MEGQDFPEVSQRDPQAIVEEAEGLARALITCPICQKRVHGDKARVKVSVGYPEADGEGYGMAVDIAVHATCLQGMTDENDPRFICIHQGIMEAAYEAGKIVRDALWRTQNGGSCLEYQGPGVDLG